MDEGTTAEHLGEPVTRFQPRILVAAQKRLARVLGPWATEKGFYLAGGTALGLHLGHRESIDFDWFGPRNFKPRPFIDQIGDLVGIEMDVQTSAAGTLVGSVDGVSLSLFRYRYALLEPVANWSGMALASLADLAAMKLAAISDRGAKRDFVDLHEILRQFAPLETLIPLFAAKYPRASVDHMIRALTHFDQADREKMPRMLRAISWAQMKRDIRCAVTEFLATT